MLSILCVLVLAVLLCLGVLGTFGGAVIAAICSPADGSTIELPARPAGIVCACLGLAVFVSALLALLYLVPRP